MLTDIFARRYKDRPMFARVGDAESALLVQAYRLVNEQLFPYYDHEKKVDERAKGIWTDLHDRISLELGLKELSSRAYSYQSQWNGNTHTHTGWYEMNSVVENWLTRGFEPDLDPDEFVKRRLSFVELAFREREARLAQMNAALPVTLQRIVDNANRVQAKLRHFGAPTLADPGKAELEKAKYVNASSNAVFAAQVHELNERFTQAGMPLHYHNGFIQISEDKLIERQIEEPFWALVAAPIWANVDTDMKEAIHRRDSRDRDPSFYAAKALESAIKIICDQKGWTKGTEKGVSDFLNHLESKQNGPFLAPWERQSMQRFYSEVRNDLGHGPGSAQMPILTPQQVDHTIEFCMSWVRSLVKRM